MLRTPAKEKLNCRDFVNTEFEEMIYLTRFRTHFWVVVFLCILCSVAACFAENNANPYAGTWDLASYRSYKTVLTGPSPTMGLDLLNDGSGSLRLSSATIPVKWQAGDYGLYISADSMAAGIDGRLYFDYAYQRVIVTIRQDAVTISEVYIFRHTADGAGNPIQPEKSISEFSGCWKSSSNGRETNDDVTLCIGADGEGLLIEQYPIIGRELDVLQCLPSEEADCIRILDSFGHQHTASLDRGVLSCDFTGDSMLKTEEYDGASRFTYSLIDNGEHVMLKSYMYDASYVEIPASVLGKPVTALASRLFANNASLVKVVVPEGITVLPARTFWGCGSLSSVQLPESLKEIGEDAFAGCDRLQLIVEHDTYVESYAQKNDLQYLVSAIDREEAEWEAWMLSSALNVDGDACSLGECGISGEIYILLNSKGSGILYSDGHSQWFVHDPGDAENHIPSYAVCSFVHADDGSLQFSNFSGVLNFSRADDQMIEQALAAAEKYWNPKSSAVADVLKSIAVPIHYESEKYYREWSGTWIAETTPGQTAYMCRLEVDGRLECRKIEALCLPESVEQVWQMHWCPARNGISIWQGDNRSAALNAAVQDGQLETDLFGEPGLRFSRCDAYGNLLDSLGTDANRKLATMLGMWTSERTSSGDLECMAQLALYPNGTADWRRVEWSLTGSEGAQLYESAGEWTHTGEGVSFTAGEQALIFSIDGEALRLQTEEEDLTLSHTADLGTWTGSEYQGEKLAEYLQTAYVGVWESNNLDPRGELTATIYLAADGSAKMEVCSRKVESKAYDVNAAPMRWWPTESGISFEVHRAVPKFLLSTGASYDMNVNNGDLEWAIPGYGTECFERIVDERADAARTDLICGFDIVDEVGDSTDDLDVFAPGQSYTIGDTIYIGSYEQDGNAENGAEPIEWKILDAEENRVLLLSEYILWTDCFHDDYNSYCRWEECALNEKLNGDFLQNAFTIEEAEGILTAQVPIEKRAEWPEEIENRIFLLSAEEAERYLYIWPDRQAQMSAAAYQESLYPSVENGYSPWWLRSSSFIPYTDVVTVNGGFLYRDPWNLQGVRPAMWYALPEDVRIADIPEQTVALPSDPAEYYAGNTIYFGAYEQDFDSQNGAEPIAWQILSVDSDDVLLISENVLEMQLYHENNYGDSLPWRRADLYAWLNGTFLEKAFSEEERGLLQGFDEELWNGTPDTRVTLLSASQTEYFFPDPTSRIAEESSFVVRQYPYMTQNGVGWWMRIDSDPIAPEDVQLVSRNGSFVDTRLDYSGGVRPVICISAPAGVVPSSTASEPQMLTIDEAQEAELQSQEQQRNEAASPDSFRWEARGDGIAILQYKGSDARVVVPAEIDGQPVTAIADDAFAELTFLEEVILPDGVVSIGAKAFYKCTALERVQLPPSVMDFGKYAFNNCPKLVLQVVGGSFAQEYAASKKLQFTTESDANQ